MYKKYYQKKSHLKKHLIMEGVRFDVYKEYEIIDLGKLFTHQLNVIAGKGAYGLVVAARDKTKD